MLKFFRSIRQKLLTENRFSKYLIYAFGEILLVVIGILIALLLPAVQAAREAARRLNRDSFVQWFVTTNRRPQFPSHH